MKLKILAGQLVMLLATALALSAASPRPASTEDALRSAGFQAKKAETAEQKKQLKVLPDGKICSVHQNGKHYYVYADKKHSQVYVGNEDQHKRFKSGLRRIGNADAITSQVYGPRGDAIEVNTFNGFGPLGE